MLPFNVVSSCLAFSPLPFSFRIGAVVFCYPSHKLSPICAFHSALPFPVRTFLRLLGDKVSRTGGKDSASREKSKLVCIFRDAAYLASAARKIVQAERNANFFAFLIMKQCCYIFRAFLVLLYIFAQSKI